MAQPAPTGPSHLLAAAGLLGASALVTGTIAGVHMWLTALRGPMCGAADGGHCWACYAAPLLAMAALSAWHAHRGRLSPAKAHPALDASVVPPRGRSRISATGRRG